MLQLLLLLSVVAVWHNQQLVQRKMRWVQRSLYKYVQHSFLLKLMPPSRTRIQLRYTLKEIWQLVPLLNLEGVTFRYWYQANPVTAFCVAYARLSFPNRQEHLVDLFRRSKSQLSTIFNNVILYLLAQYYKVLLQNSQLTYKQLQVFEEAIC